MLSYWAYVLIGNNNTGKTSFQKHLIKYLCNKQYKKLNYNKDYQIVHPRMPRDVETISVMSRSFQEKKDKYKNIDNFFENHFNAANICILSSHTYDGSYNEIDEMITKLKMKAYNTAAVFFSNKYDEDAEKISLLNWDERLWLENKEVEEDAVQNQLMQLAAEFAELLIVRAAHQ